MTIKDSICASCSRRSFLTLTTGVLGAGTVSFSPLARAVEAASDEVEQSYWSACAVNCGSRCQLRVVTKKGQVIRIETDATGDAEASTVDGKFPQVRACQRGRAMKERIYAPERLKYPMKRVGKRGEGKFERITWDEALDEIAKRLKGTIDKYGNEALFFMHGSGNQAHVSSRNSTIRFFNCIGGCLGFYSDYSAAAIQHSWPYLYGGFGYGSVRSKGVGAGSYFTQVKNAKLYVTFGNNVAVTRASGGGQSWEFFNAVRKNGTRMIFIDPYMNDTLSGRDCEWIPIRPGTDSALCEAIAYELITNKWVDEEFVRKYTVGYDEASLPKSAPKGSSYKSYIMGEGDDKTPKTPEWASRITQIPVEVIKTLAKDIGTTKPCFISQGWGPQRRMNGETQATSIAMLPILTGQIGLPGTNSGAREGDSYGFDSGLPVLANPVKAKIPIFLWPRAVFEADKMTAKNSAVKGADKLTQNLKFMWVTQSNTLINQHGGANQVAKILQDESLLETIVVVDTQMTPSAKFADILLPDTCHQETIDICGDSYAVGDYNYVAMMQKAIEPAWEQRSNYTIMTELAKRMGVLEKFTEGRTQEEWVKWVYENFAKKVANAPSWEEFQKVGIFKYKMEGDSGIVLEDFRKDPVKNPLPTPSGKIEIYSEALAKVAAEYELPDELGQVIYPIPRFTPTVEMLGQGDPKEKKYPLECVGYHCPGRTHSTYHNVKMLREVHPDEVRMHPMDAQARGLKTGDVVRVFNDRGAIEMKLRVTPRVIPQCIMIPQGAWYAPGADGVDRGGCINTLTNLRPTALGKANPSHTILVEVAKA